VSQSFLINTTQSIEFVGIREKHRPPVVADDQAAMDYRRVLYVRSRETNAWSRNSMDQRHDLPVSVVVPRHHPLKLPRGISQPYLLPVHGSSHRPSSPRWSRNWASYERFTRMEGLSWRTRSSDGFLPGLLRFHSHRGTQLTNKGVCIGSVLVDLLPWDWSFAARKHSGKNGSIQKFERKLRQAIENPYRILGPEVLADRREFINFLCANIQADLQTFMRWLVGLLECLLELCYLASDFFTC
jgi:hypothetical protein